MKKAQGLSMTTIVIAALALLVLVVLVLIFTGRLQLWGQGMDETSGNCEGFCKTLGEYPKQGEPKPVGAADPPDPKCGTGLKYIPSATYMVGTTPHYCCCSATK